MFWKWCYVKFLWHGFGLYHIITSVSISKGYKARYGGENKLNIVPICV